jgi:hypothetical protein
MKIGKSAIGAVAALVFGLSAPAMAQANDLCGFVNAAVGDVSNNFANMAPAPGDTEHGIRPEFVPEHANNCGVGEGDHHYVGCFWVYPNTTEDAARATLTDLSVRVGSCLGSGYQRRAGKEGGLIFADGKEDRAMTSRFQDKAGAWEIYVMLVGHGIALH